MVHQLTYRRAHATHDQPGRSNVDGRWELFVLEHLTVRSAKPFNSPRPPSHPLVVRKLIAAFGESSASIDKPGRLPRTHEPPASLAPNFDMRFSQAWCHLQSPAGRSRGPKPGAWGDEGTTVPEFEWREIQGR